MNTKLLAGMAVCGGLFFSSGASAVLTCSNYTTLSALQGAGSCTDQDQDLLLTYNSSNLPGNTGFQLVEFQTSTEEFYDVRLAFPGGLVPTSPVSFDYNLTVLNGEGDSINGANFDTNVVEQTGGSTSGTKQLFDSGASTPFLTLTSTNGSHDPPGGNETEFTGRTFIHVIDTLNPPSGGIYVSTSNSYETTGTLLETPEPVTLGLLGIGLLGLGLSRRRTG